MSETQPPDEPPPPEGPKLSADTPSPPSRPGDAPRCRRRAYEPPPPHPIRLAVYDDLKRSRLTVFFRLLLLIPHFVWQYVWGS